MARLHGLVSGARTEFLVTGMAIFAGLGDHILEHSKAAAAAVLARPPRFTVSGPMLSSQSSPGTYCRRLCARMDKGKAVTAAAHKLARLIYAKLAP